MQIEPTSTINNALNGIVDNLYIEVKSFPLFPEQIDVVYRVAGDNNVSYEGIITLPESVVSQWGTDDSVVRDYVCTLLGVTLRPEVPES